MGIPRRRRKRAGEERAGNERSSHMISPGTSKARRDARRVEEDEWAAKCGPVVITSKEEGR